MCFSSAGTMQPAPVLAHDWLTREARDRFSLNYELVSANRPQPSLKYERDEEYDIISSLIGQTRALVTNHMLDFSLHKQQL